MANRTALSRHRGTRAGDVLAHQLEAAEALRPDISFLAVGTNDVTHRTPPRLFIAQLSEIVERLAACSGVVVLPGMGDLGTVPRAGFPLSSLLTTWSAVINNIQERAATRHDNVWLIPMRRLTTAAFRRENVFSPDRYHPNVAGHTVWAEAAIPWFPRGDRHHRRSGAGEVIGRRRLATVLITLGWVGAVATIVGVVLGWRLTDSLIKSVEDTAALVDTSLQTVDESALLLSDALGDVGPGLESAETVLASAAETVSGMQSMATDTADVMTTTLPDSVSAVLDALPGLISTAGVLDRTLSALSVVGVDYDPEVPLDEALTELQDSLEGLPEQLITEGEQLDSLAEETAGLPDEVAALGTAVGDLADQVGSAQTLLDEVQTSTSQARETLNDEVAELARTRRLAKLALVALGIALFVAQLGTAAVGHLMRQWGTPPG